MPPIATSGHPVQLVMLAANYARTVQFIDPQLDDQAYIQNLYDQAQLPMPVRPDLKWGMHFLDLCLFDKAETCAFVLRKGWN